MPVQKSGEICLAPVGAITQAMRAKEVLAHGGIAATVVRNDPAATGYGCAYAVSYPCGQEREVRRLLRRVGIRPRGGIKV